MALDGTVKVPGIGPVSKKTALSAGAVVAVLAVILVARRKNAASSSTAPATSTAAAGQQTDPAGNVGVLDPQTGYVQGSAEDTAALAAAQGGYSPYDTSQLGGGLGGYYYGPGGSVQATPPGPGNFADNAEWAQYAESYLTGTLQANPAAVSPAIGAYLAGTDVTDAQRDIIEQAIAIADKPPQAGPGGYPPAIRLGGAAQVTVPDVDGLDVAQASQVLKSAGLRPKGPRAVAGQTHVVTGTTPKAGSKVSSGAAVTIDYRTTGRPAGQIPPPIVKPGRRP